MPKKLLILVCTCLLAGCASEPAADPAPAATTESPADAPPEEAATTGEEEVTDEQEAIVIDVRSKEEWDTGHVESAVHIPHTEIADRIAEVTENKEAKIVVYCRVGGRAGMAKEALEAQGFTNVENGGGYDDVKDRF